MRYFIFTYHPNNQVLVWPYHFRTALWGHRPVATILMGFVRPCADSPQNWSSNRRHTPAMKLWALLPSRHTLLRKLSPVHRKQWDDVSFLSERWLRVSQVFPDPPLFSPRKLSFHSSPTVWCHGRPHLSLPGHLPYSLPTLLSCSDYVSPISQAKSFSHTQRRFCPFSTWVSLFRGSLPLFAPGAGEVTSAASMCPWPRAHLYHWSMAPGYCYETCSSDVCTGAPDWSVTRLMWGPKVLVSDICCVLNRKGNVWWAKILKWQMQRINLDSFPVWGKYHKRSSSSKWENLNMARILEFIF